MTIDSSHQNMVAMRCMTPKRRSHCGRAIAPKARRSPAAPRREHILYVNWPLVGQETNVASMIVSTC
jgi:hypothetical protein